jgi:nucleoside 2-deoxyribosyltransferase
MRIYLSGPMQGHPNFNHELFDTVTEYLRSLGHQVFSPAEWARQNFDPKIFICPKGDAKKARRAGFDLKKALKTYANFICDEADIVVMLPGFENSKGCRFEHSLTVALEKPTGYFTIEAAWNTRNVGSFQPSSPKYLTDALDRIQ